MPSASVLDGEELGAILPTPPTHFPALTPSETQKYQTYQRAYTRYQQQVQTHLQQVKAENAERASKGQPLLPEDELPPHIKVGEGSR